MYRKAKGKREAFTSFPAVSPDETFTALINFYTYFLRTL